MIASDVSPDGAPADDGTIHFELKLPTFNAFEARKARPRIRHANDPEMLQADVGDVHALAKFAAQCAASAAVQVSNASTQMQTQAVDQKLQNLARATERWTKDQITAAIIAYERDRRAHAWWRRAYRMVRDLLVAAPSPPAEQP